MGECGCVCINYKYKIPTKNDQWILVGIYGSCSNCHSPVGIEFFKVPKDNEDLYLINDIPEIDFWHNGLQFLPVIDPEDVRNKIQKYMTGYSPSENNTCNKIEAEIIAEELFPDLRDLTQ